MARGSARRINNQWIFDSTDSVLVLLALREVDCMEYQSFLMAVAEHLCDAHPQRQFNRNKGRLWDLAERIRHRVKQRLDTHSEMWRQGDMNVPQEALFVEDDGSETRVTFNRTVKALRRVRD